jgi:arylsulfatase A-like enzyme
MTDNVGWGDLGSYGGGAMRGAPTPNPDRLAAAGTRFVNYYGQASCTYSASTRCRRISGASSRPTRISPNRPFGARAYEDIPSEYH